MSRRLKLTIAYDGTDFAGWQRQATERTVQAVIEDAVAPIEKRPVSIIGAGRTDAGVHAAGQVASVSLASPIASDELMRALNATLPDDVRITAVDEVSAAFNARFDARQKTYHYWVWNGPMVPPPLRRYVWHIPHAIDRGALEIAATAVIGERDFAAFQASGSDVKTTIRRVVQSSIEQVSTALFWHAGDGALLRYAIAGNGFLRHMVRNIVGTLMDVARHRRAAGDMAAILASRDRAHASATAPPQGLVLWRVDY